METQIVVINEEKIEKLIYEIRGKQVMLDSDLARLYKCKNGTKTINQAVNRHLDRFPSDFYFQLNENEYKNLWSQVGTANKMSRVLPYVFTEQGVAMLATILRTEVASQISVIIMRTFVKMRHYLIDNNLIEQKYINNLVIKHEDKIEYINNNVKLLQETFNSFKKEKEVEEIYFEGKIYDAYSKILDIFKEAQKELIIVDRYTDKSLLDMIKILKCNVILITSKNSKITKLDKEKYNKTYNNLKIYYSDIFHDRYIVIDKEKIYHSGNSVNHIGFRKSSIDIINDKNVKDLIINDINKIINNIT